MTDFLYGENVYSKAFVLLGAKFLSGTFFLSSV